MAQRFARTRNVSTKLILMQIQILADTHCCQYDAWGGQKELEEVLSERGQSNYYIYNTLCKIRGCVLEEKGNSFCAELEKNTNFKLITDIAEKRFFKRLGQSV